MASVWLLPTIAGIVSFLVVIIVTIVIVRLNSLVTNIPVSPNAPIIDLTSRNSLTEGYTLGIVKEEKPRKNGNVFFEIYPLDVDQGEGKPKPTLQSLVINQKYIRRLSRGEGSFRREFIIVLPRDPTQLPEKLRQSPKGEFMTVEGQKAWLENTFGKMISSGDEAIYESMKGYARGNISRASLAQIKEEVQHLKSLFSTEKKDEGKK